MVTGGLGGVMAAACAGRCFRRGRDRRDPAGTRCASRRTSGSPSRCPTGLGELRNGLVVRAADAVIAVGGGYGTLSEIALALKAGKRVVGIGTWEIEGVRAFLDAEAAVAAIALR